MQITTLKKRTKLEIGSMNLTIQPTTQTATQSMIRPKIKSSAQATVQPVNSFKSKLANLKNVFKALCIMFSMQAATLHAATEPTILYLTHPSIKIKKENARLEIKKINIAKDTKRMLDFDLKEALEAWMDIKFGAEKDGKLFTDDGNMSAKKMFSSDANMSAKKIVITINDLSIFRQSVKSYKGVMDVELRISNRVNSSVKEGASDKMGHKMGHKVRRLKIVAITTFSNHNSLKIKYNSVYNLLQELISGLHTFVLQSVN